MRLIHGYASRGEEMMQSTSGRIYGVRGSGIWDVGHGVVEKGGYSPSSCRRKFIYSTGYSDSVDERWP
jgi:hypothetical protein